MLGHEGSLSQRGSGTIRFPTVTGPGAAFRSHDDRLTVAATPFRVLIGWTRPTYSEVFRRSESTGSDSQEMRQARPSRVPRITLPRLSLALVVMNILWRVVRYSLGFPLWGDEAFVAMNLIHRDFSGLVSPLDYGQIAPLGFMWAELAVARVLGLSEWALRLLPFVAGVLAMLLFWRFAQKTLKRWDALLAVAIFAASYFPVRHASEVKPYAGDLLVALVLIALAWSVHEKPESRKRWAALIASAGAGIWLSFPSAFVIGAICLLLTRLVLSRRDTRLLGPWLVLGLCVTLSFTAMYLVYARPHAAAAWPADDASTIEEWGRGFPPLAAPWRLPVWLWDVHAGNMLSYPYGGRYGASTVTMLAVLVGATTLWRTRKALLLLLLGPLAFNFIAAALHAYPYGTSARFSLHMAPAFCLLAGVGSMRLIRTVRSPRRRVRWVHGIALFMVSLILGGMAWNLVHPYKYRSDLEIRRVLRSLSRQAGPSDRWISFNVERPEPPQIDASWRRRGGTAVYRYYLSRLAPVPLHWAPDPSSVTGAPGSRIWLLAFKEPGTTFDEDRLDDYVDSLSERFGPAERIAHPLQNGKGLGELAIYRFTLSGTPLAAAAASSAPPRLALDLPEQSPGLPRAGPPARVRPGRVGAPALGHLQTSYETERELADRT